jgi:hypothetical protein
MRTRVPQFRHRSSKTKTRMLDFIRARVDGVDMDDEAAVNSACHDFVEACAEGMFDFQ